MHLFVFAWFSPSEANKGSARPSFLPLIAWKETKENFYISLEFTSRKGTFTLAADLKGWRTKRFSVKNFPISIGITRFDDYYNKTASVKTKRLVVFYILPRPEGVTDEDENLLEHKLL